MTPEQSLREKLRKIEALFAGAATEGEKVAVGAAAERIRDRLGQAAGKEKETEVKFSISDRLCDSHEGLESTQNGHSSSLARTSAIG